MKIPLCIVNDNFFKYIYDVLCLCLHSYTFMYIGKIYTIYNVLKEPLYIHMYIIEIYVQS